MRIAPIHLEVPMRFKSSFNGKLVTPQPARPGEDVI